MTLHKSALLTAADARAADKAAIAAGATSAELMANAAAACTEIITHLYAPCPTLIICGQGNNGADGRLIAGLLKKHGWAVSETDTQAFNPSLLNDKQLVVDALFGTGLNRVIEGAAKEIIEAVNESKIPVVAVDIASGINATSGEIMGAAMRATHSISFVRPKLGQILMPGKTYGGELHVADIGISGGNIVPKYFLNKPDLWRDKFPFPKMESHKYSRGHTLIMGGKTSSSGAARLAAIAALRAGSGLVSVACDSESLPVYAATLTAVMTKITNSKSELELLLDDERINSVVIGPGYGVGNKTHDDVLQILAHRKSCVIDADAISSFKNNPQNLFSAINSEVVMTPHEGEFSRIFKSSGNKAERASQAAEKSRAVIVLKGSDTVIAAPDGRVAVNNNAPAWLATAGSGDVLSGIIAGLMAQGMQAFDAACAGVWIHGEAANEFGAGMIAEDLPQMLPRVLQRLQA